MLLPPMVYVPRPDELVQHFRSVAEAVPLPIMLYNNPPAYRTVIDADVLQALADVENIVAVKESAPDTRRFTDFRNVFGDRFALFARSEEHTSELQSLMRISYAVFCLKKKKKNN